MRKIYCAFLVILALSLSSGVAAWATPFSGGDGSAGNPYIITTPEHLDAVRNHVTSHFRLGNDIDLTDYLAPGGAGYAQWGISGWLPIDDVAGSFDGNEHRITGLWINRDTTPHVGLFGAFALGGTIKNLGVEIAAAGIRGGGSDGLVGVLFGTIENSFVTGLVSGGGNVGGLVGTLGDGTILNSYFTGTVNANDPGNPINSAGGLVGRLHGHIGLSYATGNVSSVETAGGLVGSMIDGSIWKSYATGNVSGVNTAGGLVGSMFGHSTIGSSYATGNVSGNQNVGGLAGFLSQDSSITNSFRYKGMEINGVLLLENTPDGIHGGIVTAAQLMARDTYETTHTNWVFFYQFHPYGPYIGSWHWDTRGFPKLNIGTEDFPFAFTPSIPMIYITTVPAPNTTVTQGSIIGSLSVVASAPQGATLSYRWYSNTINSNIGGTFTGVTTASFTLPTTLTVGIHYFYVVVSATGGPIPVASNVAAVTVVGPAISITTQPAPNTTVTQGSITGSLTVGASVTHGATLSYRWYSNTARSNMGGTFTEVTTATFTIPTTLTPGTHYFYVVVSATDGAPPVVSNVATVTVIAELPESVTLPGYGFALNSATSRSITAIVYPAGALQNLTWHSSNPALASVDQNGVVTANDRGRAGILTITVTTENGHTASLEVIVLAVPVQSMSLRDTLPLYLGSSFGLRADFYPTNATYAFATWSSSNPEVASVEGGGYTRVINVVAHRQGSATITARSFDGHHTASSVVTVTRRHLALNYWLSIVHTIVESGQAFIAFCKVMNNSHNTQTSPWHLGR